MDIHNLTSLTQLLYILIMQLLAMYKDINSLLVYCAIATYICNKGTVIITQDH